MIPQIHTVLIPQIKRNDSCRQNSSKTHDRVLIRNNGHQKKSGTTHSRLTLSVFQTVNNTPSIYTLVGSSVCHLVVSLFLPCFVVLGWDVIVGFTYYIALFMNTLTVTCYTRVYHRLSNTITHKRLYLLYESRNKKFCNRQSYRNRGKVSVCQYQRGWTNKEAQWPFCMIPYTVWQNAALSCGPSECTAITFNNIPLWGILLIQEAAKGPFPSPSLLLSPKQLSVLLVNVRLC